MFFTKIIQVFFIIFTERNKRTKRKQARRERIKEKSTADSDGEWLPVGKGNKQNR